MSGPSERANEVAIALRIGGILTCESVFGNTGSLPELIEIITRFDRDELLDVLVDWSHQDFTIRMLFGSWRNAEDALSRLIRELLPRNRRLGVELASADDAFISPFCEISVLSLLALVCRYSPTCGGRVIETEHDQHELFRALLMLQGGMFPPKFLRMPFAEQFPIATSNILATICTCNTWSHDLARLHLLLTIPEVGFQLQKRAGITVREWFERRLGCSGEDYLALASTSFGASLEGANLAGAQVSVRPALKRFWDLCSTTPDEIVHGNGEKPQADPVNLFEATRYGNRIVVRPVISLKERHLVTSPALLFNKFHRGLPYLCLEARQNPREDGLTPRTEFGYIFEGYFHWLLSQWFQPSPIPLFFNFLAGGKSKAAEHDAALVVGETALLFELKTAVPPVRFRSIANLDDVADLLNGAAKQLDRGARALLSGQAWVMAGCKKTHLPKVSRVVPIAVVFESFPVRWPFSESFEESLAAKAGLTQLFSEHENIFPMQVLDIQEIEMWEDFFMLPQNASQLMEALIFRATNPLHRWTPFDRERNVRENFRDNPGLFLRLSAEAEVTSKARLKELLT